MASLSFTDKKRLEDFLGMSTGYVLELSNPKFQAFVQDSTGRNIFDELYNRASGSKANRLRAFWEKENDAVVGKLTRDLVDYAAAINPLSAKGELAEACKLIAARLCGEKQESPQPAKDAPPEATAKIDPKQYGRLLNDLQGLMKLAPHPRGFAFESFLNDVFFAFGLAPRKSFRLVGEQIDGSFNLVHETYLVEAKWTDAKIGNAELQGFAGKVRTKSAWSRGLYVSYSGFSEDGLTAFRQGSATHIICLDGYELWQIFTHKLNLAEVLALKTRRAAETGRAHFPVRELYPDC